MNYLSIMQTYGSGTSPASLARDMHDSIQVRVRTARQMAERIKDNPISAACPNSTIQADWEEKVRLGLACRRLGFVSIRSIVLIQFCGSATVRFVALKGRFILESIGDCCTSCSAGSCDFAAYFTYLLFYTKAYIDYFFRSASLLFSNNLKKAHADKLLYFPILLPTLIRHLCLLFHKKQLR